MDIDAGRLGEEAASLVNRMMPSKVEQPATTTSSTHMMAKRAPLRNPDRQAWRDRKDGRFAAVLKHLRGGT